MAHALKAEGADASEDGTGRGTPLVPVAFSAKDYGGDAMVDLSPTLRAGGHNTSHANAGVMPAVAFHPTQDPISSENVCHSISSGNGQGCATAAVAIDTYNQTEQDTAHTIRAGAGMEGVPATYTAMQVRRLTPVECERLQGFPDEYTRIPWKNKPASECPDGPRYKALGNSMAVPCMTWIGEQIQKARA